ncbi:MAG: hypothetical protein IJ074_01580 [Clostridia bacterium]|nr:hypothetical protein [Clostridia bacterium]
MKIYDFEEKFFDYCRTWMALHPGLTDQQIEDSYNEMMLSWLNAPAKWLDGVCPGEYFTRYTDPKDLMKLLEEYDKRDIGLPEPLYSRIVALGESCAPALTKLAERESASESLRSTAIALLRDIGSDAPLPLYVELVSKAKEENELSELASEVLCAMGGNMVGELLERYPNAPEYAQLLILDICCNFPGTEGLLPLLEARFRADPRQRAFCASLMEKIGDAAALPFLEDAIAWTDITYLDYIEIRNTIESLGGDPGEERTFYGDEDYEAMRLM